ncbi:clotting factor G beta subunit-like [Prorops nasuta]|uniref:clotting factor G beta subunit-like n=1 Tax=Prorops nasuta TaxID=863751 RepID=UPI0034CF57C4
MFKNFAILFVLVGVNAIYDYHIIRRLIFRKDLAEPNEFPFMAAILLKHNREPEVTCILLPNECVLKYPSHDFHCTGVIISRQFVLTTAKCILYKKDELDKIRIRTGTNSLLDDEGDTHEVESYHIHNITRRESNKTVEYHTIGLYKLKTPMKLNDRQRPIRISALPKNLIIRDPGKIDRWFSGDWYGTVVGWGFDNRQGNTLSEDLRLPMEYIPALLKAQNTVMIERVPRCKRYMKKNDIPYNGHEICVYYNEPLGNDGAVLLYENKFIGVAIHYDFFFRSVEDDSLIPGGIFVYVESVKDFIYSTATDYYEPYK